MRSVIEKWKDRLGLHLWNIDTQKILSEQVVYPNDCVGDERFFIGVEKDHNRYEATIYHDVPLYEEAIIHELLHIRYPDKSEDWVNERTDILQSIKKKHNDALNYFNNLLLGFANAQQVATTPTEDDKRKSIQQLREQRDEETSCA